MKLGDLVAEVRERCDPTAAAGLPYVGLEHIGKGTLTLLAVGGARDVTSAKKRFRRGDVLFGTLRPAFRKVVQPRFDGVCSTDIAVLRPRAPGDAAFALYALADPRVIEAAARSANGTRMPRASFSVLAGLSIPAFSAPARARIGARLALHDDLIENNRRRIALLEDIARTLHREWRERVPDGSTAATLADHVDDVRAAVSPGDLSPDTPYFGLEHLPRRATTLAAWGRAGDVTSRALRVARGDILFGKIRPYFHKAGVAPVDGLCSSDVVVLRPRRDELRAWVLGHVSSDAFVARATASSRGARMPRADWALLRRDPLPAPPPEALRRYDAAAGSAVDLAMTLALESRALAAARDLLAARLFDRARGRISAGGGPRRREGARAGPSPAGTPRASRRA